MSAPQAPGQLWRLRRMSGSYRGPLNADVRRHMTPTIDGEPPCERSLSSQHASSTSRIEDMSSSIAAAVDW